MESNLQSEDVLRWLPSCWHEALAGHVIEPAKGMGGASIFRVSAPGGWTRYLKVARGADAEPLAQEITRTEWLSSHGVRVPGVLMKIYSSDSTAVLMTAVPGRHLTAGNRDVLAMAYAIGRGLARLHAVPAANCPFDEMPRTRLRWARDAIDRDLIDPGAFDDRNAGVAPAALHQRLVRSIPAEEDIVVVHGDATLENMLIGADGELGFVDCGHAGRSDRYLDLAVVEAGLRDGFGSDAAGAFKAAYGIRHWDERKAAFFLDLYELF